MCASSGAAKASSGSKERVRSGNSSIMVPEGSGEGGESNGRSGEGGKSDGRAGEGEESNGRSGEGGEYNGRSSESRESNGRNSESRVSNGRSDESRENNGRNGEGSSTGSRRNGGSSSTRSTAKLKISKDVEITAFGKSKHLYDWGQWAHSVRHIPG